MKTTNADQNPMGKLMKAMAATTKKPDQEMSMHTQPETMKTHRLYIQPPKFQSDEKNAYIFQYTDNGNKSRSQSDNGQQYFHEI